MDATRLSHPSRNLLLAGRETTRLPRNLRRANWICPNNGNGLHELIADNVTGPTIPSALTPRIACTFLMGVRGPEWTAQSMSAKATDCELMRSP